MQPPRNYPQIVPQPYPTGSEDDAAETGLDNQHAATRAFIDELRAAVAQPKLASEAQGVAAGLRQRVITELRSPDDPIATAAQVAAPDEAMQRNWEAVGYRLVHVLGAGGMGIVYEAEDIALHRRVAIKVMKPDVAAKPANRQRFLREARTAATLESDHVCPIWRVDEGLAIGVPFIVMPLLKGDSLEVVLRQRGRLDDTTVAQVGLQAARGLLGAHTAGLLHRDIKPANLWLETTCSGTPRVKLLDFGLARPIDDAADLTSAGTIVGTPAYMAPEQARAGAVDARADLFSLGVVLYEARCGQRPFAGQDTLSILTSLAVDHPPAPTVLDPMVDAELSNVIVRLLAKAPDQRPASAALVIDELARLVERLATRTTVPSPKPALRFRALVYGAFTFALLLVVGLAYKFTLTTNEGTLHVEVVGDDADIRFQKGVLHVYDNAGKLQCTIAPGKRDQALPAGKFTVQVTGADGLTLESPEIEIKQAGKTTIRVVADNTPKPAVLPPAKAELFTAPDLFPGKLVVRETFADPKTCPLPIIDAPPLRQGVVDGRYAIVRTEMLPGLKALFHLGDRLPTAAFAARVRVENALLVINTNTMKTPNEKNATKARWQSLAITPEGQWTLVTFVHEFDGAKWNFKTKTPLATGTAPERALAAGQWINIAVRWSPSDGEWWLNGQRIHRFTHEGMYDFRPSESGPLQVILGPAPKGVSRLDLAYVAVWDQTGLKPNDTSPKGPNLRP